MPMKRTCLRLGAWLLLPLFCPWFRAEAQIALQAEMSQFYYLQYEPVHVRVTLRNLSGHPLAFGENRNLRGALRFEIAAPHSTRYVMPFPGKTPVLKGVILQPGTSKVFTFNLAASYDVRRPGSYLLKAVISHPQLTAAYESNPVCFTVVTGSTIWESEAGIPKYLQKNRSSGIPTRRYRIVSYPTGTQSIYVLLIEDRNRVYLVRRLGRDLGMSLRPRCAVDDLSRLHLLVAASPKVFAYYQYDITGRLENREIRIKSGTYPRLEVNRDLGTITLTGGRRARKDRDYEEIKDLPFLSGALEERSRDITGGKSIIDKNDGRTAGPSAELNL